MSAEFYLRRLQHLVGKEITGLVRSGPDEWGDEFFGLIVDGRKIVWFLQDDEGNGPGSFSIEWRDKEGGKGET